MSTPRCIRPGKVWMVTRRTTRRHYLLRPDENGISQQIYWYTTAVLAKKFGIEIHAVQMLSTHIHEVLTDTRGMLPAFLRERNRALANALKCHRKWPEEVFQRAAANCIELFGVEAILRQIGYTLANCVEAGLVASPDAWPGVGVAAHEIGSKIIHVERPAFYFDPTNPVWPAEAELSITMPSALTQAHGTGAAHRVRAAVENAVATARELAHRAGRIVSNVASIFKVAFTKRSRSYEPFGAREPTFAAAGNPEFIRKARTERAAFLDAYRRARDALKRTGASVIPFPEGTWRWLRELLPLPSPGTRPSQRTPQCQTRLSVSAAGAN